MSIIENILKTVILDEAVIIDKEALSKTVFKIRLQSDSLKKTDFAPGATLRMGIGIGKEALSMKNKMRTYSVWDSNKSEGYLDLAYRLSTFGLENYDGLRSPGYPLLITLLFQNAFVIVIFQMLLGIIKMFFWY